MKRYFRDNIYKMKLHYKKISQRYAGDHNGGIWHIENKTFYDD